MDTSETYIKMCEKAVELQKLRGVDLWQNGDCYTCVTRNGRFTSYWTDTEDEPYPMYNPKWLPRQDQLQEIDGDKTRPVTEQIERFARWCSGLPQNMLNTFATCEQLWLRFVMLRDGKTWNGEDWE